MRLFLFLSLNAFAFYASAQDIILERTVNVKSADFQSLILKTESNIGAFVDHFKVRLDSGSKIVKAKVRSGSDQKPIMKVSIRKCVLFICQTIDLDADFSLEPYSGECGINYLLRVDLRRSTAALVDLYSSINTNICIRENASGADVEMRVILERSPEYHTGIIQRHAFALISLQGESILESFKKVMLENGAEAIH